MAFEFKVTPVNHILIVGTGRIKMADCLGIIESVISDPRCSPESTALVDLRKAKYDVGTWQDLIRIAKALEAFHDRLKNNIAIVAKRSTLFPAEIFASHVRMITHVGIRVFLEMDAAEAFCRDQWNQRVVAATPGILPATRSSQAKSSR